MIEPDKPTNFYHEFGTFCDNTGYILSRDKSYTGNISFRYLIKPSEGSFYLAAKWKMILYVAIMTCFLVFKILILILLIITKCLYAFWVIIRLLYLYEFICEYNRKNTNAKI